MRSNLEARGVHAWFGKHHALEDISIDFNAGSVTALIGPSGCGKSTFIRTLNRMHEFIPSAAMAGEVLLDGKDIYAGGVDVTKIRLQIGMVFQKPNPFPKSIFENVAYGLRVNGINHKNFVEERVETSLRQAALWDEVKDKLKKSAFELSGGQQQRVAIARALVNRPKLLLADEPTGNLDPEVSDEIMSLLKNIAREGTAILMATHDYRLIQKFGGTVCKLEDRSLKQVDAFQGVS